MICYINFKRLCVCGPINTVSDKNILTFFCFGQTYEIKFQDIFSKNFGWVKFHIFPMSHLKISAKLFISVSLEIWSLVKKYKKRVLFCLSTFTQKTEWKDLFIRGLSTLLFLSKMLLINRSTWPVWNRLQNCVTRKR